MKPTVTRYFLPILVIFHGIGLFLFYYAKSASNLTWLNLMLCGTLVFLAENNLKKASLVLTFIFFGGYFIELIGTKTGYLFGDYAYGEVLGWRFLGVSVIIGMNWFAIVVAAANWARLLKWNVLVQALVAGVLCVVMDFIMEPVAIKFGFWSWSQNEIPMFNYITWFIFATVFSYVYLKNSAKFNLTAAGLYIIWACFFLLLGFA